MDSIIRNLNNAQWNQEFAGYLKNIKQLRSHIYIGDYSWLKRFGQFRDFQFIKDPLFDQNLTIVLSLLMILLTTFLKGKNWIKN
jgi:hypothetical protein